MITDDLGLSQADRSRLEKILMDFEERWSPTTLSDTFANLVLEPDEFCRAALSELIKIDLHRHWKNGNEKSVDDYQPRLESVGIGPEVPASLILAEYLARHAAGKTPQAKEIRRRYPAQFDEFKKRLAAEKERRSALDQVQASINTDAGKASIDTKTEASVNPHALPETFGRYQILRQLGAGAMGAVYLAHDTQLDRQVALKTPSFGGVVNDELVQRFYREARAAANLRHPNVCPVFDVGQIDGRHYITMAFINGRPLSDFVGGSKPLDQKGVAVVVRKLARALAEAHKAGIIHRDLKPANIMVDQKQQPMVMDFGLARRDDELQSQMTQTGAILGTPAYMSPEQVKGKIDEIGPQADIYSLGVILYELLTGQLPFEGTVGAVIGQILTEAPDPPNQRRPDTDSALEAICLKMIAKDPSDRYSTMKEVAADLAKYIKGQTTVEPAPTPEVSDQPFGTIPLDEAVFASPASPTTQAPQSLTKLASPPFWKTTNGRYVLIGAGVLGLLLAAWGITLIFRTPFGTLTITTEDPNIIVEIDGRQINIRDDSPIKFTDGTHDLALRIGEQRLPIGDSIPFEIVGREGKYRLSATLGETELRSDQFTIDKGKNQSLRISLTPLKTGSSRSTTNRELQPANSLAGTVLQPSFEFTGHAGPIGGLAAAPSGRHFASASADQTVRVWDTNFGREVAKIDCGAKALRVAFDQIGLLAIGCDNGDVVLWDSNSARKVGQWNTQQRAAIDVTFSPDGRYLATAGDDGTAKVWYSDQKSMIRSISAHAARCNVVCFTPDGKKLLTGGNEGRAKIWELNSWTQVASYAGHDPTMQMVFCADISPDGRLAVTVGNDGYVHVWEVDSGNSVHRLKGHQDEVISVQFAPDGNSIVSGSFDGTFRIWDVATGTQLQQGSAEYNGTNIMIFGLDGKSVVSAGGINNKWKPVGHYPIRLWMLDGSNTPMPDIEQPAVDVSPPPSSAVSRTPLPDGPSGEVLRFSGHSKSICGLEFTPDGTRLVSNSSDRTIRVWDVQQKKMIWEMGFQNECRDLSVSPDSRYVVSCGTGGKVAIFDLEKGTYVKSLRKRERGRGLFMGVDYSPDGTRVAAACLDKIARVWDAQTTEILFQFPIKAPENADCNIQFTPNGKQLVVAPFYSPGVVQVFNAQNGQLLSEIPVNAGARAASSARVVISPDGRRFASGSWTGNIIIGDLSSQTVVNNIRVSGGSPTALVVDYSPDGRWIAAAHSNGKIFLVDAQSQVVEKTFQHSTGSVTAIDFSPDSRFLATASAPNRQSPGGDLDIRVWRLFDRH